MAFTLPQFNLDVDIYTGPWLTRVLRLSTVGNLAFGKRVIPFPGTYTSVFSQAVIPPLLLLPPLTDVRDMFQGIPTNDLVEVPSGSGRWYSVIAVEDIGKGFDNEHRCASLTKIAEFYNPTLFAGLNWPIPMP